MEGSVASAVCVYCASSPRCAAAYHAAAGQLGRLLAEDGWSIVYGGSRVGSMGALADAALAAGGRVVGVLPEFLRRLEIAHERLTQLHIVEDMRTRKAHMLSMSRAVVALPGGLGTFEELLEALTLKKLGAYDGPIVLVNTLGYFAPLLALLQASIAEGFLEEHHRRLWTVVETPDDARDLLRQARA
jgi:uncharacterized protein (TIGR00730 family)